MYHKQSPIYSLMFIVFNYRVYKRSSRQLQYSANSYSKPSAARLSSTTGSGAQKQEIILLMKTLSPRRNYLNYL